MIVFVGFVILETLMIPRSTVSDTPMQLEPLYISDVADFSVFSFASSVSGKHEVELRSRVCHMESTQSLPMLCQH